MKTVRWLFWSAYYWMAGVPRVPARLQYIRRTRNPWRKYKPPENETHRQRLLRMQREGAFLRKVTLPEPPPNTCLLEQEPKSV